MATAISLNILLGLCWVGIGVVVSKVASSGRSIIAFYWACSLLTAGLLWITYVRWPVVFSGGVEQPWRLVGCMVAAGVCNAAGQVLIAQSMRRGHQGLSWAIAQSAMVVSFGAGWLVWHDQVSVVGWWGVGCLLLGIGLLAYSGGRGAASGPVDMGWLGLAVGSLLVIGVAQMLMGLPSRWEGFTDTARLRTPVSLSAGTVVHAVAMWRLRRRLERANRGLIVVWVMLAYTAYVLTFVCLDLMARFQLVGIVFPVGIGVCVFGFSLYSRCRLRERFAFTTVLGLLCNVTGVVLLAFARR